MQSHRTNRRRKRAFVAVVLALVWVSAPATSGPAQQNDGWVARHNIGTAVDYARAIALSPDGDIVYVTGHSGNFGGLGSTVAYNADSGAEVWTATFDPWGLGGSSRALAVSPDGATLYIGGSASRTESDVDYAAVAYDAFSGQERWVASYSGSSDDRARSLALSPAGDKLFVTGSTGHPISEAPSYQTVAFDVQAGSTLWAARYAANWADEWEGGPTITVNQHAVFVTGSSGTPDWDYSTVALDAEAGTELWTATYSNEDESSDRATATTIDPAGARVFVTGYSTSGCCATRVTVAYDASDGSQLWVDRTEGEGYAIAVSPNGDQVYTAGVADGNHQTIAHDADSGVKAWTVGAEDLIGRLQRIGFGSIDSLRAITATPGRVFVTGSAPSPHNYLTGPSQITAAYDASTGRRIWAARSDEPEGAWAIAARPDGDMVFVTGSGRGVGTGYDYETAAFRAGVCPTPEDGPISGSIDGEIEPVTWGATALIHRIDCELIAANGL